VSVIKFDRTVSGAPSAALRAALAAFMALFDGYTLDDTFAAPRVVAGRRGAIGLIERKWDR